MDIKLYILSRSLTEGGIPALFNPKVFTDFEAAIEEFDKCVKAAQEILPKKTDKKWVVDYKALPQDFSFVFIREEDQDTEREGSNQFACWLDIKTI